MTEYELEIGLLRQRRQLAEYSKTSDEKMYVNFILWIIGTFAVMAAFGTVAFH